MKSNEEWQSEPQARMSVEQQEAYDASMKNFVQRCQPRDKWKELYERISDRIQLRLSASLLKRRCDEDSMPEDVAQADLRWVIRQMDNLKGITANE